jgi:hypothetical protein
MSVSGEPNCFRKPDSVVQRSPFASKANPTGCLTNGVPSVPVPAIVAVGVGLLEPVMLVSAENLTMLFAPEFVTQRLPSLSNASAEGLFYDPALLLKVKVGLEPVTVSCAGMYLLIVLAL